MSDEILIKLKSESTPDAKKILSQYKEKASYPNRVADRGIVNEKNNSFVMVKESGDVNVTRDETSNVKVGQTKIIETTPESVTITNRKTMHTDEIIINNHKLNPQILELSDTRVLFNNPSDAIGNLAVDGTVLVKTWEEHLGRYVLIRRKIRTPLFSHTINAPAAPANMDLSTDYIERLDINSAILLKEEKEKRDKAISEMQEATGGSNYDQGDYNNYETEFNQSSDSITSQGGYDGGYVDTSTKEENFGPLIDKPTSVVEKHVSTDNTKKRPGKPLKLEYITIHSTGNLKSTASGERRYLDNPGNTNEISWHICIDDKECIEAIPLNEVAWHAGSGNSSSIGIEICESGNREKTLERAAELTASLLKSKGWGLERLKRHYDWTEKNCPRIFNKDGKWSEWESYKNRVQRYL